MYGPTSTAGIRTPVLSACYNATTGGTLTGQYILTPPGTWSYNSSASALPADVSSGTLVNPNNLAITLPYDGIYNLYFQCQTSSNPNNTTQNNQSAWFSVKTSTGYSNLNARLAFTSTYDDSLQATFTGFFRAGDQVQPQVYSYNTVNTINLNSNAPILTVTLITPAINYTSSSAQMAGAVITS